MIKCIIISVFLLFAIYGANCNGIVVTQISGDTLSVLPGKVVTVVVQVKNDTKAAHRIIPKLNLSIGWQPVSGEQPFDLAAGATTVQLFSIHIPSGALSNIDLIQYSVHSLNDKRVTGFANIRVFVEAAHRIVLAPVNVPDYIIAGEKLAASFVIQNLGNIAGNFSIKTTNCDVKGVNKTYLPPGASFYVEVHASTLGIIKQESRLSLRIEVVEDGFSDNSAYLPQSVRVLPRYDQPINEASNFPIDFRINHLTRRGIDGHYVNGFQGELYANGFVDEERRHHIEAHFRGPNDFNLASLGLYEEYFAQYESPNMRVMLGDNTFQLSNLTEASRYGRGAELAFRHGRQEIGGFFNKPRFLPGAGSEMAGYFQNNSGDGKKLSFNVLHKNFSDEQPDTWLSSVQGGFPILKKTGVETEVSKSWSGGVGGSAFSLRITNQSLHRLQLSGNILYASKNFSGYFSDSWSYYGVLTYQVSKRLRMMGHVNQDAKNASQDTLFGVSPFSKFEQIGFNYKFSTKTAFNTSFRRSELKDLMPDMRFHYSENIAKMQLSIDLKKIRFTWTNEMGGRNSRVVVVGEGFSNTFRSLFNTTWQPSARHYFFGNAQFYKFITTDKPHSKQWIFGAGLNSKLSAYTQLTISCQSGFILEEYYRNRNLLDVRGSHQFGRKKRHEFVFACNYMLLQGTEGTRDFSIQSSYVYHLGINTTKKSNLQTISGRIINGGVPTVAGVVLYLNGQRVETNADGDFIFHNIPKGEYFLLVEPSSFRLHEMMDVRFPIKLMVQDSENVRLIYGLTKGGTVSGKVEVVPAKTTTIYDQKTESPKVFNIEITNGDESFRQLANSNGEFEFTDIRPGKWKLRVINSGQYKGWNYETQEYEVILNPDEKKYFLFKLIQKKREIKFQNSLPPAFPKN